MWAIEHTVSGKAKCKRIRTEDEMQTALCNLNAQARFKRRILHAPNRIAKLSACKMRRLNQLNTP